MRSVHCEPRFPNSPPCQRGASPILIAGPHAIHGIHALVPAAGSGARMQRGLPKQYLSIGARTLLEWSVGALLADRRVADVLVVVAAGDARAGGLPFDPCVRVAAVGGESRAASVRNGLAALRAGGVAEDEWVLVHDAARPCLAADELGRLIDVVLADGAVAAGGLLALPLADTLKRAGEDGRVAATLDRRALWRAATPQMFRVGRLADALDAPGAVTRVTDEASAVEALGDAPRLVPGHAANIKVTTPDDLALAAAILRAQGRLD